MEEKDFVVKLEEEKNGKTRETRQRVLGTKFEGRVQWEVLSLLFVRDQAFLFISKSSVDYFVLSMLVFTM